MKKYYTYYSILRPIGPGTIPRGPEVIINYDRRKYIPEIGREAWGHVVYNHEIDAEDYDLVPAPETKKIKGN